MRLPDSEHGSRPWLIHEMVPDFILEDVWALPTQGGPDDFHDLLDMVGSFDPVGVDSRATRLLWGLREWLGRWLDLGEPDSPPDLQAPDALPIPGTAETSLLQRVPPELRGTRLDQEFTGLPFVPLYRTDREAAAELSNRTVHAVGHLSWVEVDGDRYEGRMAVYVKPRGTLGRAYMASIKPFRYLIVYPAMMRHMERAWQGRLALRDAATA